MILPKGINSSTITNLRPIFHCNVIYKCLSNLIYRTWKKVLLGFMNETRGAFVLGNELVHNVLLRNDKRV